MMSEKDVAGAAVFALSSPRAAVVPAVAQCVHADETSEPDPQWVGTYRSPRERFKKLYPALDTLKE